ncbi:hypothetical protein Celaphus_00000996 [Cervus elaphus hippelaphus]|uniref:Lipoxygenase domain-containing protein n=1 Tax=Cervus elaphus hippelaphus TaxID=46360 RepID=A0A212D7Q5_CEREH|nr:hypothetical protein Celaphus_00000996 [Cervus elaphus hippelaphus]
MHEMNTHLLRTHYLMETFALDMLRQPPMCHPIFKVSNPASQCPELPHALCTRKVQLTRSGLGFWWSAERARKGPRLVLSPLLPEAVDCLLITDNVRASSSLDSCADLIEFLTMTIFSCSAQHIAVNTG